MCEIQFVMSHNINDEEIVNFLDMLNEGSYANSDATGLCTDNGTKWKFRTALHSLKDPKSGNLLTDIQMNTSKFLIGHNRLATTGDEKMNKNNHPFETSNLMLVHNGIISNHDSLKGNFALDYPEETDSAIIIHLMEAYLEQDYSIIKAIKETAECLQGSYSVMVYYKPENKIFYFKNSSTSFAFMKTITKTGKISLYGSTKTSNLVNCYDWTKDGLFDIDTLRNRAYAEPKAGIVYELTKNKLNIDEVGTFTPVTTRYPTYAGGTTRYYSNDWESDYGYEAGWRMTGDSYGNKQSKLLMKGKNQADDDIEDDFEDMITEIGYLMVSDDLMNDINASNIVFHNNSRAIVIENLNQMAITEMDKYVDLKEWVANTNPMGTRNVTITYDNIQEFLDNFGHKHMNNGAIK